MFKSNSEGMEPQIMTLSMLMSVGLVGYGFLFTHIYVCMYFEEGSAILWHGKGSQRTVYGSQFSLPTTWVLESYLGLEVW